jgi:hypothetical protein
VPAIRKQKWIKLSLALEMVKLKFHFEKSTDEEKHKKVYIART